MRVFFRVAKHFDISKLKLEFCRKKNSFEVVQSVMLHYTKTLESLNCRLKLLEHVIDDLKQLTISVPSIYPFLLIRQTQNPKTPNESFSIPSILHFQLISTKPIHSWKVIDRKRIYLINKTIPAHFRFKMFQILTSIARLVAGRLICW
jgi:hypothetical protein